MTIASQQHRPRGFTLIELVMVILILGILAGIAVPRLFKVTAESEAATVLANVRTIFDAAEMFAAEHGRFPDDVVTGGMPSDLLGYLPESLFTQVGPFGGYYDWNGPGTDADHFGVSILVSGALSPELRSAYKTMENLTDDGAKDSGWITVSGQRIYFELAPKNGAPAVAVGNE